MNKLKNTLGSSVSVTIFGESHGKMIGAILDGLAPGIHVDEEFIASQMNLRKAAGSISTARHEADAVKIVRESSTEKLRELRLRLLSKIRTSTAVITASLHIKHVPAMPILPPP